MSARATITPPEDFISDGSTSFVEFRQLIKTSTKRSSDRAGQCLIFRTGMPEGWREDFNARDPFILASSAQTGLRVSGSFMNNTSGEMANVKLSTFDSPLVVLTNDSINGKPIIQYNRNDDFETYATYFTGLDETDENFGEENRHALAVMSWNWSGVAQKKGSLWKIKGIPIPNTETTSLSSQPKEYLVNNTGERSSSGAVRVPGSNLIDGDFQTCPSLSTITLTSQRDIAVWRKNNGVWYIMNPDGTIQNATQWGVAYDIPVPGDYDGDGRVDFAVYRPDDTATIEDECQGGCSWFILKSSDGNWLTPQFGLSADKVVPADFDGDGRTDIAVFRPSTNTWHIVKSSDNTYYPVPFGQNGDVPIPSDYDGDGVDDIAVWSPTNAIWSILNSSNQSLTTQAWGYSSDKPVIGDYDGDGKTDIANWQSGGNWHILLSGNSQERNVNFGLFGIDTPVPGNYDGDDKTDIAVWRPNGNQQAVWYILNSSNNQVQGLYWGTEGDIPIPAAYRR